MNGALASHYARALADAVLAPGKGLSGEVAVNQFRDVESLVSGSHELERALLSPAVPKREKQAILGKIAGQLSLHPLLANFLRVLVSHRRINEITHIRQEFEAVIDERMGWIPADITSATELDVRQKQSIERVLADTTGKQIRARYKVDPGVLAGIRAQVGSKEYDATLSGRLGSMRQRLAVPN